jgi:hypothetical protein
MMATMSKIYTYILVAATLGFASRAESQFVGRYAGEFMAAGGGARSLAMGGAGVALPGDPWSLFFNPAGLTGLEGAHLGLMHSERFAGVVDYDAASYAAPQADGRMLALGFIRLGVNGIPFTRLENSSRPLGDNNRVEVDKYANDGEYAFYAARAGQVSIDRWGLGSLGLEYGLAPKLVFKHIGSYRAYGLGMDAGLQKRWGGSMPGAIGLGVRDLLGTLLAWEQTGRKELIVSTFRLGGSVSIPLPALEADLMLAADETYRTEALGESSAAAFHGGLEYMVKKMVALRAGSDDGRLTYGGGLNFSLFALDYAFIGHDELGDTHRISLTARWGK